MSNFDKAISVILQHEGGWVSNPVDPGGETNFGISIKFIHANGLQPQELGILNFLPGCLKGLTVDKAKELYKKYFWKYDSILNDLVATKIFDCAVNCGPTAAHKIAQRAANSLGAHLKDDGALGNLSVAAINACQPTAFVDAMAVQMSAYYQAIIAHNPSLSVFLKNWTKRANWKG